MSNKEIALFWFRRDLRLEDNVGLYHCLKDNNNVLPVFIFDKEILNKLSDKKDRRVDFIHQAISRINQLLIEQGSSLLVLNSTPIDAFQLLSEKYNISAVYTNRDYEPSAIARDIEIEQFLKTKNIEFKTFKDQVVFEKSEVVKANGEPYTIFTPYSNVWKKKLSEVGVQSVETKSLFNHFYKTSAFKIPTLAEIGFEKTEQAFSVPVVDTNLIKSYDLTRNTPSVNGTTKLSVHLRFGTISTRALVQIALKHNETWLNELIWREFFMMILFHFPYVVNGAFKKKYDAIRWRNNEDEFKKWCNGQTGYPIVDAGMRELNETGFMHNRVRMVVASFLTKHLLIDWRWGEAYFAEKLIDYELSANNGNWQWSAGCGCDAAPYFRVFNPSEQTKKFDSELKYIHKWVKEINDFSYPKPMVEHAFARDRALKTYKESLQE